MSPPSAEVCAAFGVSGRAIALDGGAGRSFRVGDVVLKYGDDSVELAWVQALTARMTADGFRVAAPVATVDGDPVHHGWAASTFVDGLRPAAPDWDLVRAVGRRFGAAATQAARALDPLPGRRHRWAVADRCAWDEERVQLALDADAIVGRLRSAVPVDHEPPTVIHGDLTGNVHLDPEGEAVVLDVTPYIRPARWADAIVVADAVLWHDAPVDLIGSFASSITGRDLVGRALVFRLIAEQLADRPRHGADLAPFERVVATLERP
ncbi:MAG: hypothetical protein KDA97_05610 [Acidimicrobiales bacterium]|nr:hypothetical protein [Acidimicrobiales bacterium]